jgi:hypothetical protein
MSGKTAMIAGGLGVIGRNLLHHLEGLENWEIVGPNLAMLVINAVEAIEAASHRLARLLPLAAPVAQVRRILCRCTKCRPFGWPSSWPTQSRSGSTSSSVTCLRPTPRSPLGRSPTRVRLRLGRGDRHAQAPGLSMSANDTARSGRTGSPSAAWGRRAGQQQCRRRRAWGVGWLLALSYRAGARPERRPRARRCGGGDRRDSIPGRPAGASAAGARSSRHGCARCRS